MCTPGLCAEGYAFFAVVDTGHGEKFFKLDSTFLADAVREVSDKKDDTSVLLYIESRRQTDK